MRKKNKNIYICLIVLFILGISIGYAAINRTLDINGNSEVKQNTWNIHFENIQVTKNSVVSPMPTIDNTNSAVNFSCQLNVPGDFYEFTVDVVNEGTIDAMIDSIIKTPELTEAQKKYLSYKINYQNENIIDSNQLIESNSFVKIKIRIEYKYNVSENDLPTTTENLNLGFTINYIQATDEGETIENNGALQPSANGSLETIGESIIIGSEEFYIIGTDNDNIKLLAKYNLYVGNECTTNTSSSCTSYGNNVTGLQDINMKGFTSGTTSLRKGTTAFSSDTKKGTNYSTYEGSIVEELVNNYKTLLIKKYNLNIVEARLITKEELTNSQIGCSLETNSCANAPRFIYEYSYWTQSSLTNDTIYFVRNDKTFVNGIYNNDFAFGVRPVIVIPKNTIAHEK